MYSPSGSVAARWEGNKEVDDRVGGANIAPDGGRGADTLGGGRGKEGGGGSRGAAGPLLREESLAAELDAKLDTGLEWRNYEH